MTAATTLIAIPAASQSSPDRSVLCDPIWHKSAPREIRDVCGPQGGRTSLPGWDAWRKRLADTSRPTLFCQLPRGRTNPLTWALPDEASHGATRLLLAQLSPLLFRRGVIAPTMESLVREWLADGLSAGVGYAWESLAWCYGLARLASVVSSEAWWDLLEHLLGIADRASSLDLRQEPVTHQLLAGELPLALACLLPEINACRKRSPGARRQLSRGLRDLLDGEGFPRATHLDMLRPLLACWTRAAALGSRLPKGCWNESAQGQYRWLVRQALRTTRSDGSHVLSRGPAGTRCDDLFAAALHFGGDETARQMASIVLPPGKRTDRRTAPGFPAPAEHSEWAQAAVLRARWLPSCPRLTVLFPDQTVRIELESAGEVLWSGQWARRVRRDGGLVAPRSTWRETCWVSKRRGGLPRTGASPDRQLAHPAASRVGSPRWFPASGRRGPRPTPDSPGIPGLPAAGRANHLSAGRRDP